MAKVMQDIHLLANNNKKWHFFVEKEMPLFLACYIA